MSRTKEANRTYMRGYMRMKRKEDPVRTTAWIGPRGTVALLKHGAMPSTNYEVSAQAGGVLVLTPRPDTDPPLQALR